MYLDIKHTLPLCREHYLIITMIGNQARYFTNKLDVGYA